MNQARCIDCLKDIAHQYSIGPYCGSDHIHYLDAKKCYCVNCSERRMEQASERSYQAYENAREWQLEQFDRMW